MLRRRLLSSKPPHQRALEVDHIIPKNQGGSDDLRNLQALCFRCNAGKQWEARAGLWVLRAGGQQPGAAGERTGADYRRCLSLERRYSLVILRRHLTHGLEWSCTSQSGMLW